MCVSGSTGPEIGNGILCPFDVSGTSEFFWWLPDGGITQLFVGSEWFVDAVGGVAVIVF